MRRSIVLLAAALLFTGAAYAQDDAPSLGEVARQARLQKQQKEAQLQTKDASAKSATNKDTDASAKDAPAPKSAHVITNEELPAHVVQTSSPEHLAVSSEPGQPTSRVDSEDAARQWKSLIQSQKQAIASLQAQMKEISDSIHYAGGNCIANCVQWNERQKQKQDQVESMKAQLEDQQKHLEDLQESARKQGFGSSVYDP